MLRTSLAAALGLGVVLGLGLAEAGSPKAIMPFDGKNLKGWQLKGNNKEKSNWVVGKVSLDPDNPSQLRVQPADEGVLINAKGGGVDIYTEEKLGDCRIEVEVMVPRGSNSGIYVMGEYEVQVLDSYGKDKVGPGDIGGLYGAAAPRVNAAKKPGEWQQFVIDFQAPRFENGRRTEPAKFLKITLNGETIHENVEMNGPTPSGVTGRESETGPLMFQGDHGAVAYRNIKITPK